MNVAPFVNRMRAEQELLFSSTVTITRFVSEGAFDPDTAEYGPIVTSSVYAGPALVRPQKEGTVESGEVVVVVSGYQVKVPVDTDVEVGDVVTITASTYDAALVDLTLRVSDVSPDEWQICRVAHCVDQKARPT